MAKSSVELMRECIVREAYSGQYNDPIRFRAGETVQVGQADPDYPEWYWCRGPDGREGWVHASLLSLHADAAVGLEDYSARELTVAAGEGGRVLRVLGGWVLLELDDGRTGWVPEHIVAAAA